MDLLLAIQQLFVKELNEVKKIRVIFRKSVKRSIGHGTTCQFLWVVLF
jgi:hypothetical protein